MCYYALSFPTHVRSSRRRWRWVSAVLDLLHPRLAGSSTMALPLRPDVRFTACTIECPRTGVVRSGMVRVASDSRRMWPKMESRLRQIRLAKPSSPVCLVRGVRSMEAWTADWYAVSLMRASVYQPTSLNIVFTTCTSLCGVVLDTVLQEKYLGVLLSHDM